VPSPVCIFFIVLAMAAGTRLRSDFRGCGSIMVNEMLANILATVGGYGIVSFVLKDCRWQRNRGRSFA
jgi:hypothetical protein